jgi:hypothetical protein
MIEAELPDGTVLEFPEGTSPEVIQRVVKQRLNVAPVQQPSFGQQFMAEAKNSLPGQVVRAIPDIVAGSVRGPGSIGATLLTPVDAAARAMGIQNDFIGRTDRREAMDAALRDMGADTDSLGYQGSKLVTELLGTGGVGGILAKGAQALKAAPAIVQALRTGGFNAGGVTGAKGLAVRAAGGGGAGYGSAALVDPESAAFGGAIGAALPVVGRGVAVGSQAVGRAMRPADVKIAEKLAQATGAKTSDIISALRQQGPQLIPGYQRTAPQILQSPELSQLQRTLKTAGVNTLGDAERLQQSQFIEALNRVAPVQADVVDAAQRAGGAIQNYALPAKDEATMAVRGAFDAVDPFNETQLFLPIDEMQGAVSKYLGPGTFGTGSKAAQAVKTAQGVGTETLEAIAPISQKAAGKSQSLEQAVRAAGGIRGSGGELRDLGIKQSGTTGLINNKTGQPVDLLADEMYRRGFLPDNDPATLFDMLRNGAGRNVFADDVADSGMQRAFESAMGDAPGAKTIAKTVPFGVVQNLRSSIGEAAEQASAKGANKEAAALREMVAQIDSSVNRAAGSSVRAGEYFPQDIADQYRKALAMHQEKMLRFETGPQASMFRKGGDGQASIQGAEIPGKFYNAAMSQADDIKAFKRLIGNRDDLAAELKSFAMTQGAGMADAQGTLGDKFVKWARSRSGANKELFSPNELATIREVGRAVQNQIRTEGLGRVTGSDTAQKLASLQSNGILDSRALNIAANRIPIVGQFTGPMLQGLKDSSAKTRNETMARLLANPDEFAKALQNPESKSALIRALIDYSPNVSRAAPVAIPSLAAE